MVLIADNLNIESITIYPGPWDVETKKQKQNEKANFHT